MDLNTKKNRCFQIMKRLRVSEESITSIPKYRLDDVIDYGFQKIYIFMDKSGYRFDFNFQPNPYRLSDTQQQPVHIELVKPNDKRTKFVAHRPAHFSEARKEDVELLYDFLTTFEETVEANKANNKRKTEDDWLFGNFSDDTIEEFKRHLNNYPLKSIIKAFDILANR